MKVNLRSFDPSCDEGQNNYLNQINVEALVSSQTYLLLPQTMEQCALRNVNNCMKTDIFFYLEASGGQSYYLNLNVVRFFNTSVN